MFKVVVVGSYAILEHPEEREILGDIAELTVDDRYPWDMEELKALLRDADGVITDYQELDAETLAAMERCRVIAQMGAGYDNIDARAAAGRGIMVCHFPGGSALEVAEHAISLALTVLRDVHRAALEVKRDGLWDVTRYRSRRFRGSVYGVVGFGRIGRESARLAEGLGMRVLAADPARSPGPVPGTRDTTITSLDEVLAEADVVCLHTLLNDETRGLIGARELDLMKPSAYLVNVARGPVVDEEALLAALREGAIAGAALDVLAVEPMVADHPLREFDNVLITPHLAWMSEEAKAAIKTGVATQVRDVLQGRPPAHPVPEMAKYGLI